MLKKVIKYVDYADNFREETFYFNLNKAELTDMQLSTTGGLDKLIEKISESQDTKTLISLFKEIILKSYGDKSPDGRRFIKSQELRDEFSQTEAFVQLYMELIELPGAASAFVNGIMPKIAEPPPKN